MELIKYKCPRLKWLSLKKSHAHSDSESHLNNENCYFLCVLEGSTPLYKFSIGMHANIVLRNRKSTPHVTIFWKFWSQKLLKQMLNFNLSLLWWCRSRILFKIKASEQRHLLVSLTWSPRLFTIFDPGRNSCAYVLHRFEFKIFIIIWIMTKLYSLNFIINNHHH